MRNHFQVVSGVPAGVTHFASSSAGVSSRNCASDSVMEAFEQREDRLAAVGELATVGRIGRRPVVNRLSPDEPLGDRDVAHEIAEREGCRLVGPLHLFRRNACGDAPGALAHALEVMQELVEIEHWPSRGAVLAYPFR